MNWPPPGPKSLSEQNWQPLKTSEITIPPLIAPPLSKLQKRDDGILVKTTIFCCCWRSCWYLVKRGARRNLFPIHRESRVPLSPSKGFQLGSKAWLRGSEGREGNKRWSRTKANASFHILTFSLRRPGHLRQNFSYFWVNSAWMKAPWPPIIFGPRTMGRIPGFYCHLSGHRTRD